MLKYWFLFLLTASLSAERVDIVSSFTLDELVPRSKMAKVTGLKVRYFRQKYDTYYSYFYKPDIKKVIVFADLGDGAAFSQTPLEKRVIFFWEAPGGRAADVEGICSRIYTFNDDVIDGKKYFKFYYPVRLPMLETFPSFKTKKFCCLMTHRRTPEREQMIRFFETKPVEDLEYYGFSPIIPTSLYRGQIPGHPLSIEKLDILKNFRFCICFENAMVNGYITEKIFTCFAAGCIPIYLGAPNIENYIPKDCFIDYRDFSSDEELYQFLKAMPEENYKGYLHRIAAYLKSEKASLFSPEYFSRTILECVNSP